MEKGLMGKGMKIAATGLVCALAGVATSVNAALYDYMYSFTTDTAAMAPDGAPADITGFVIDLGGLKSAGIVNGQYEAQGFSRSFDPNGGCFAFIITPPSGCEVTLQSIQVRVGSAAHGPTSWEIHSGAGPLNSTIDGNGNLHTTASTQGQVCAPTEFRIYAYGGKSQGVSGIGYIDDLNVRMDVRMDVTAVPEPVGTALCILGALATGRFVIRKYRRKPVRPEHGP